MPKGPAKPEEIVGLGSEMPSSRATIAIPVYNMVTTVRRSIESALDQTLADFTLILSDNASTDGTSDVCAKVAESDARVRYLRWPYNVGAAKNFNVLPGLAETEYFKWLAADESIEKRFLEVTIPLLDAHPEASLATTRYLAHPEGGGEPSLVDADLSLLASEAWRRFNRHLDREAERIFPIWSLFRTERLLRTRLLEPFFGTDHCLLADLAVQGTFVQSREYLLNLYTSPDAYHRIPDRNDGVPSMREIRWFDPDAPDRRVFGHWEHLRGYAQVARDSTEPRSAKIRMLVHIYGPVAIRWRRRLIKEWFFGVGLRRVYTGTRHVWHRLRGSIRGSTSSP